jgi:DNA anti-recombination protein RmuC
MRNTGILALAFSAALLTLGCDTKSSSNSGADSKVSIAKDKIGEAADATAAAAKAKRDEYAREMQKRLDEFDAKCKDLEARIAKSEGQAKKDLEKKYEQAKPKRDAAAKKLEELKEASHDRWEKIKDGVESSFEDLKKHFE